MNDNDHPNDELEALAQQVAIDSQDETFPAELLQQDLARLREVVHASMEAPASAIEAVEVTLRVGGPIGRILADEIRRLDPDRLGPTNQHDDRILLATIYNLLHEGTRTHAINLPDYPAGAVSVGLVATAVGEKVKDVALRDLDVVRKSPDGAALFTNLAGWYAMLGQHEEANRVAAEAVAFFEIGAESANGLRQANRAAALGMLCTTARTVGNGDQALLAGRGAVTAYRELVRLDPARYKPDLARCLVNWAGLLRSKEEARDRIAAHAEAVELYRTLDDDAVAAAVSKGEPAASFAWKHERALALIGYASALLGADEVEDAESVAVEAVEMMDRLYGRKPNAYVMDWSQAHVELALVRLRRGRPEEALAELGSHVSRLRQLWSQSEEARVAYAEILAQCLTIASNIQAEAGRTKDAYASLVEAIRLSPDVDHRKRDLPRLAARRFNLAILAEDVGDEDRALEAIHEACRMYEILGAVNPEALRVREILEERAAKRATT